MRPASLLWLSFFVGLCFSLPANAQPSDGSLRLAEYEKTPAPERAAALSKAWRIRGDWFRQMPQFNNDSAGRYYHKALTLLEKTNPQPVDALTETYAHVAAYYLRLHDYTTARKLADKAWQLSQQAPSSVGISPELRYQIRRTQAFVAIHNAQPDQSLSLLFDAVRILETDPSAEVQARLQKDKGMLYRLYQNQVNSPVNKGLTELQQSRSFFETHPTPDYAQDLYDIYWALITQYNQAKKLDSCSYYFDKMVPLLPVLNNPENYVMYYSLRGNNLNRRQRYPEARKLIAQGLTMVQRYRLTYLKSYPYALNLMGVVLTEEKRFDEAMAFFVQARDAAVANKTPNVQRDFLFHMIDLHQAKGDYKTALDYSSQFADEAVRVAETFSLNTLRENELKVNLLQKENQLTRQQAERHTLITVIVAGVLLTVLLGVILVGLYRRNQSRQRTNQQLSRLNAELATKNTELDRRNAENELLLKEIHHRVKNNLEVISSLLQLQSARIDDPSIQEVMLASQNRVQSMGILHQKLYQSEHLAFIEMKQYFVNLSENILDSYNEAGRITIECPMPEMQLDIDTALPVGLIANELLTNALKYAFPKQQPGRIRLSLEELGEDKLRLCIADNGVGKLPAGKAQGTGFGTQLVELLTRQLDGHLRQEAGQGTTISIQFRKMRLTV